MPNPRRKSPSFFTVHVRAKLLLALVVLQYPPQSGVLIRSEVMPRVSIERGASSVSRQSSESSVSGLSSVQRLDGMHRALQAPRPTDASVEVPVAGLFGASNHVARAAPAAPHSQLSEPHGAHQLRHSHSIKHAGSCPFNQQSVSPAVGQQ